MKVLLTHLLSGWIIIVSVSAAAATDYVNLNNATPSSPFTSWSTAAQNIQDAIDVAVDGDLILVTNGIYTTGGRAVYGQAYNPVAIVRPLSVISVNGPSVTTIQAAVGYAYGSRCAFVTNGALLAGFTLSGGRIGTGSDDRDRHGAGLWCTSSSAVVSNCIISGNTIWARSGSGGGAYGGRLVNCIISGNSTPKYANVTPTGGGAIYALLENCVIQQNFTGGFGGGAINSTLVGCTVVGNTAGIGNLGGGTAFCTLSNCIVFFNNYNNVLNSGTSYCCTTPLPTDGTGNIASTPLFVDQASGDMRLQSNSPCINAGYSDSVTGDKDIAGYPRIIGGAVDIGAHEYQSPSSVLSYAWAEKNGIPTDGSADFADPDGDGMNNYGEWRSDTNPTNALSVLRMLSATNSPAGAGVTWQSVSTRSYRLERAGDFGLATPFQSIATGISGDSGTKTFIDTSATNGSAYFYRVGVH